MCQPATAIAKWEEIFEWEKHWEEIFTNPYKVARETDIQSLQFQILHRYYPCNLTLGTWYKDHKTTCDFCDATDDLEHYFCLCHYTQIFWNQFNRWWSNTTSVHFKISVFEVIFGIANPFGDKLIDSLNYCILLAKMFISHQKKGGLDCFFY